MVNKKGGDAPGSRKQQHISGSGKGYQFDAEIIGHAGDVYIEHVGDVYYEPRSREILYGGFDTIFPSLERRVERSQPQTQLQQWITGRSPLVGIVGQSGFGKTMLAKWSLDQFSEAFDWAEGVHCTSVRSFGEWAGWVLQENGFLVRDPQWTDQKFANELMRLLSKRRCLLVLDRLEVLTEAKDWQSFADFLADWQQRGQNSTIILTTQQEMGLAVQWLRLGGVEPSEGCLLLEQKGIVDEGQGWRSQLSEAAEGHPLLLNLAASWLRQEKPQATVSAEDLGFFRRLFQRYQGNPEAQVEEVFADLFARLPDGLRQELMDVSVYRIAFDEAMAEVMGLLGIELDGLVEQGFLTVRSEDGRWTLHPLMARLVRNAAKENGSETGAHERAIAFFDSHRQAWTGNFEDCWAEFESFHHCCEMGQYGKAYQVMETCVNVLEQEGCYRLLVPIYEQLTEAWQPFNEAEIKKLGWAWTRLGFAYRGVGRYRNAIVAQEQAQQRFQSIEDRDGEGGSLCNLGIAYASLGQYQFAIDLYQQALVVQREVGNRRFEANSLGSLGNAYNSLGQYQQAIQFFQQSLDLKREIGDRYTEGTSLRNLGIACENLGQSQQAIEFYQQALVVQREVDHRKGEADSLYSMARSLAKLDRRWEARQSYEQAQQIYESLQLDHSVEECKNALYTLGQIIPAQVIPAQVIRAPQIRDESDAPTQVNRRQKMPWWGWFLVGVAIVLAIAWLLRH